MNQQLPMSRAEVLRAFAVEQTPGKDTLARYLTAYPQYANDLVDLSRELNSPSLDRELSAEEVRAVDAATARFRAAGGLPIVQALKPQAFVSAAASMQLPLQSMIALRERRVELSSIPARFLQRLALELGTSLEQLSDYLGQAAMASAARQNKSSMKPGPATKVSFEKVLLDAGVPTERVQSLLEQGE
ncbi:hypothetical protein [Pseudomonas sp. PI1]|uniref:hypothetical protein n=1 Tax=Pseudomonas sp. PI1 TaxID=1582493 RepID=UPI001269C0AA|nr:hypothetical protein [Pseudomonas sp. PI1]